LAGPHFPIDHFFRSLADDQGAYAIGIVLSGRAPTEHLVSRRIKAREASLSCRNLRPRNMTGCLEARWQAGLRLLSHSEENRRRAWAHYQTSSRANVRLLPLNSPGGQDESGKLFMLIRAQFGNDLTQYKPATLDRRIERRMTMHKIGGLESTLDLPRVTQTNSELCTRTC
jgi:two-component system CheB/CheR fusion protein